MQTVIEIENENQMETMQRKNRRKNSFTVSFRRLRSALLLKLLTPKIDGISVPLFGSLRQPIKICIFLIICALTVLTIFDSVQLFIQYSEEPIVSELTVMFNKTIQAHNPVICIPFIIYLPEVGKIEAYHPAKTRNIPGQDLEYLEEKLSESETGEDFLNGTWDDIIIPHVYHYLSKLTGLESIAGTRIVAYSESITEQGYTNASLWLINYQLTRLNLTNTELAIALGHRLGSRLNLGHQTTVIVNGNAPAHMRTAWSEITFIDDWQACFSMPPVALKDNRELVRYG